MRLDDTSIRDGLTSADALLHARHRKPLDQAERQYQRLKTLRASGMASAQQMEDAEIHRNTAQSDKAAAASRVVTARQQLQRTEVRAPFDGVVSERKTSAGDTAAIGKELVKVIDPTSVRFDGFVSADQISNCRQTRPKRQLPHQRLWRPGILPAPSNASMPPPTRPRARLRCW